MQSVASLMSFGRSDIGNLDDLEEEEEEKGVTGVTSEIQNITLQLDSLEAHGNPLDEDAERSLDDCHNPFGSVSSASLLLLAVHKSQLISLFTRFIKLVHFLFPSLYSNNYIPDSEFIEHCIQS